MLQTGAPSSRYQIHLKSNNGSICVLLVNRDSPNDQPVVVSVPPPDSQNNGQKSDEENITGNIKMRDKDKNTSRGVKDIAGISEASGMILICFFPFLEY